MNLLDALIDALTSAVNKGIEAGTDAVNAGVEAGTNYVNKKVEDKTEAVNHVIESVSYGENRLTPKDLKNLAGLAGDVTDLAGGPDELCE